LRGRHHLSPQKQYGGRKPEVTHHWPEMTRFEVHTSHLYLLLTIVINQIIYYSQSIIDVTSNAYNAIVHSIMGSFTTHYYGNPWSTTHYPMANTIGWCWPCKETFPLEWSWPKTSMQLLEPFRYLWRLRLIAEVLMVDKNSISSAVPAKVNQACLLLIRLWCPPHKRFCELTRQSQYRPNHFLYPSQGEVS
jgi:hypothetical protein